MRGIRLAVAVTLATLWVVGSEPVSADVPRLIHYQGHLVDSNNVPLEGPYTLTFTLYSAQTGGTVVWQEIHTNTQVSGGNFEVLLGAGNPTPTPLPSNEEWVQPLWLGIKVGTDPELAPRQQITSVPLAFVAEELAVPVTTSTITDDANRLVPTGAIILWTGASCPTGYSRVTTMDDRFLVSGSAHNAVAGGSNTHDHGGNTGNHTLTVSEIPSHSHTSTFRNANGWAGSTNFVQPSNDAASAGTHTSDVNGGGQGHSHTVNPANNKPEFATVLLCQKN